VVKATLHAIRLSSQLVHVATSGAYPADKLRVTMRTRGHWVDTGEDCSAGHSTEGHGLDAREPPPKRQAAGLSPAGGTSLGDMPLQSGVRALRRSTEEVYRRER